ncbi:MAG: transglutaminase family protein [Verrucomicrobiota bacterium]|nr:transglutaminase family protein [Verrucomicrobiota bacterium]
MIIKIGFDIEFELPGPTPMILMLYVHPSRQKDLRAEEIIRIEPEIPLTDFTDLYGNRCARIFAPAGNLRLSLDATIEDSGQPDEQAPNAVQNRVEDLPDDTLPFLLTSRYCEVDKLSDIAWKLFGETAPGWPRVQAICTWVHKHITFGYHFADSTKSAFDVYKDGLGVCRDFSHLALAFCRCMNIPARYATGYMGDIGVPLVLPMDLSGWIEVYLGDRWYTLDARHNVARIGRVVMARGRDAADVALTTNFGRAILKKFFIVSDEISEPKTPVL